MGLSLGRSLVAALALHALGLALVARAPEHTGLPALAGSSGTPPSEIEIELRELSTPRATAASDSEDLPAALTRRAGKLPEQPVRSPVDGEANPPAALGAEALEPAPITPPEPPAPGQLSLEQLGVGSATVFLETPPKAPRKPRRAGASVAPGVDRSMRDELAQKDLKVGFGAHGPVIAALERWTRAGGAPQNGTALFFAQVDDKGRLVHVAVVEAGEAYAAWNAVADRTLASLRKQKLRVPRGARGVALHIRVESRVQMPSGADPGLGVRALGIPLKRGEGPRSAQIDILSPSISFEMVDSPLPGHEDSDKLPVVHFSLPVLGVTVDPVDIGAKRLRMVHARLVGQSFL